MDWIDSHTHLTHIAEKGVDISSFLNENRYAVIDIGTQPGDLKKRLLLSHSNPNISYTAGLYPELAGESDSAIEKYIEEFRETVFSYRNQICAIGEFGLDYHYRYGTPEKQIKLARKQIELAIETNLPVVIHTREADEDIIRLFCDYAPVKGVIHCFSSGASTAQKLLEIGFFLSFSGNLTYKNAEPIREAALIVPPERVLFETDSPYLAPVPVRGTVNTPANVEYVYRFFSELRGIPIPFLKQKISENINHLFGPIFGSENPS